MISVENRSRPIWIGKTGVMVPATMACTAMGISGVPVTPLVAVSAGGGVMATDVEVREGAAAAVSCGNAGAAVGEGVCIAVGEAGAEVLLVALVGLGTATAWGPGRFMTSMIAATATDKSPPTKDQRALTTYRCLTR